jgi:hypothetical protein
MSEFKMFCCSKCKFSASSKFFLVRHNATKKHAKNIIPSNVETVHRKYQCNNCDKCYKGASGLWTHNKKCKVEIKPNITENVEVKPSTNQDPNINNKILEEMHKQAKINEMHKQANHNQIVEMKKMTAIISSQALMLTELRNQPVQTIVNNTTNNNNTFNMNVFLNEKCNNAVDFDYFIKNLKYELSDAKTLIDGYVSGTCDIIRKNLEKLPINKRPLHYLVGEDPHQQLMHIRKNDKWDVGTQLNWMQQIHADDDDEVVDKNPIYYALKKIDDDKIAYLAYNFNQNKEYMLQHGRLVREITRPDFKERVYQQILSMITLNIDELEVRIKLVILAALACAFGASL